MSAIHRLWPFESTSPCVTVIPQNIRTGGTPVSNHGNPRSGRKNQRARTSRNRYLQNNGTIPAELQRVGRRLRQLIKALPKKENHE
jgi:hypothetical protein